MVMVSIILFENFVSIMYTCVGVYWVLIQNVLLGMGWTKSFENADKDHGLSS